MVYNKLGLIFIVLAFIPIHHKDIVLSKLIAKILDCGCQKEIGQDKKHKQLDKVLYTQQQQGNECGK